ncbi:MAG: ImmA/IrrE family metallo-endopeptidase [Pyrinomonadaceae bacterium]
MKAIDTARKIAEKFGTRDCFAIAEKSGVKIVYENWYPATIGEFDKAKKTICVNLRALANSKFSERKIVAHELGHFFAAEFDFDRKREESFARDFADELTK